MRPLEMVPAAFLLLVAGVVFFGTSGLSYWNGVTPGARFFPAILAGVATIVAILLVVAQRRGIERVDLDLPSPRAAARVLVTILALMALAYGAPRLGFVPMLAAFVLVMLRVVLRRRTGPSLLTSAIVAGFVHLVFVRWLAVPIPMPFGV